MYIKIHITEKIICTLLTTSKQQIRLNLPPHCSATLCKSWIKARSTLSDIIRFFFSVFFFFGRGYIHIQVLVHCSLTGIRAVETRASVLPSFIKAADYKIILNTSLHTLKQCLHLTLKRILANASSLLPSLLLVYFLHGVARDSCLSWFTVIMSIGSLIYNEHERRDFLSVFMWNCVRTNLYMKTQFNKRENHIHHLLLLICFSYSHRRRSVIISVQLLRCVCVCYCFHLICTLSLNSGCAVSLCCTSDWIFHPLLLCVNSSIFQQVSAFLVIDGKLIIN